MKYFSGSWIDRVGLQSEDVNELPEWHVLIDASPPPIFFFRSWTFLVTMSGVKIPRNNTISLSKVILVPDTDIDMGSFPVPGIVNRERCMVFRGQLLPAGSKCPVNSPDCLVEDTCVSGSRKRCETTGKSSGMPQYAIKSFTFCGNGD